MSARTLSTRLRQTALATTVVLGLAGVVSSGADAAVITVVPNVALTATPFIVSFGANATYAFTPAITDNGPGAAVATSGSALVSSFFGSIADFFEGATIDQTGPTGFSAFPTASVIPNSPALDFIGLSFTLPDGQHFGYASVAGAALLRYAYESTPGASINAIPEPASLGLLLAGIAGLAAYRRRIS